MLIDLIRVPDPNCIDDLLDEPLGLLYLGASLKNSGYKVRVTNLAGCSAENWKTKIKDADLYGIQLYTPTVNIGIEIAKFIKTTFPKRPVVCGGAHASALPESEELKVFDHIVIGEGERSLVSIADAYRDKNSIPKMVRSEFVKDLDSLPFPDRSLVDMNMFHRKVEGHRCFGIIGSRGCSYRCAFCDRTLFGEKIRIRSVDNVVAEIKDNIQKYNVRHFEFFDDILFPGKKDLLRFKDAVKGLNIIFRCNCRADMLTQERAKILYESGCRTLCFGIESGSQKMLDLMKKDITVEENLKAIKIAQEANLTTIGYFILGFPGETKQTIQESIDFIKRSNVDQAQFYTFTPLPGCEVYKYPERFGAKITSHDFSQYYLIMGGDGRGGMTMDTDLLSAEDLQDELKKIRQFLKERTTRGHVQDYYVDKLKYKIKEN